jgi:DNA-binding NtrC family response regulator
MLVTPLRRKVMVLNDKKSIRNLLCLLERIESETTLTQAGEPLQSLLDERRFDAVVLDMRRSNPKDREEMRGIREVRVGRAGKLLILIAEVNGPRTMDLFERYILNGLPRALLWLVSHRYHSPQAARM